MLVADSSIHSCVGCYSKRASTRPILCILSDGTQVVVKYPDNPEGNLVLINEMLSYRIGDKIGLDVPKCGVCELNHLYSASPEFLNYCKQPDCEFSEKNYGLCFYSSFISRIVPLSTGLLPHISNKEIFYKMLLFDHLVYNKDRHPGNLLVCTESPLRCYAIDHSHVFKGQCIWDTQTFLQGMAANDYTDEIILVPYPVRNDSLQSW